jgi:hypothetical protein
MLQKSFGTPLHGQIVDVRASGFSLTFSSSRLVLPLVAVLVVHETHKPLKEGLEDASVLTVPRATVRLLRLTLSGLIIATSIIAMKTTYALVMASIIGVHWQLCRPPD